MKLKSEEKRLFLSLNKKLLSIQNSYEELIMPPKIKKEYDVVLKSIITILDEAEIREAFGTK